jgi:phosphodiesterase/alkaline phosphatase D-like protein
MNKNIIIGVVVVLLLGFGIYYLSQTPKEIVETPNTNTDNTVTPTPTNTNNPTPSPVPGAPIVTTNSNYNSSTSTASVTGEVNPNGPLTSYWFEYGETTSLGSKTGVQQVGSGFLVLSAPAYITGLKANTSYYFRLSAKNIYNTVNGAVYKLETNSAPVVVGSVPTTKTLAATDIARNSANLRGQVNTNSLESKYWFEYGKDINFGNITPVQILAGSTSNVAVAMPITGLDPLSKYYFRLNSQNSRGTSNGLILNFTTLGPVAVSAPSVNAKGASGITGTNATLNGNINPNGAETTYWFEYSEDSLLGNIIGTGTPTKILAGTNTATNVKADITGLSKNTKYYFHLVARNQAGTTESSIMSFTTKKN